MKPRWISFVGVFRDSPPLNFYVLQAGAFLVVAYLFLSWDFSVLGLYPEETFAQYRNVASLVYWSEPLFYITSFQCIYAVIPRPSVAILTCLQLTVVASSVLGILGLWPRLMARVGLVIGAHLIGMHLIANSAMGGGTSLSMYCLLVLSLAPRTAFYRLRQPWNLHQRDVCYHWPVFLFLVGVGYYYSIAGVNKIVESSVVWPHDINLGGFSQVYLQKSVFLQGRQIDVTISTILDNVTLSVLIGYATLVIETSAIGMLFVPRMRWLVPAALAGMHVTIYFSHGYGGYLLYLVVLAMCLDFNRLLPQHGSAEPDTARGSASTGWVG